MKIRPTIQSSPLATPKKLKLSSKNSSRDKGSSPFDGVRDTFRRGYISTMVALPGALKGGAIGAGIGLSNTLPLAFLVGLKPALVTAGVLGCVGAVAGGALYHSLATLD